MIMLQIYLKQFSNNYTLFLQFKFQHLVSVPAGPDNSFPFLLFLVSWPWRTDTSKVSDLNSSKEQLKQIIKILFRDLYLDICNCFNFIESASAVLLVKLIWSSKLLFQNFWLLKIAVSFIHNFCRHYHGTLYLLS